MANFDNAAMSFVLVVRLSGRISLFGLLYGWKITIFRAVLRVRDARPVSVCLSSEVRIVPSSFA